MTPPALPKVDVPATGMPVVVPPGPGEPPAVIGNLPVVKPGPMAPPQGNLIIVNDSAGWSKVSVNGTSVGLMAPQSRATLHDVPSGGYDVAFIQTDGYSWTHRLETCGICKANTWEPGK